MLVDFYPLSCVYLVSLIICFPAFRTLTNKQKKKTNKQKSKPRQKKKKKKFPPNLGIHSFILNANI